MQKLNWREKYAAILILTIGIIYLIVQVLAFISSKSDAYSIKDGSFVINKSRNEFFSDIRSFLTIILAIMAGILLFRTKLTGWVIGFSLLLFFLVLSSFGVATAVKLKTYDNPFIMVVALEVIFLLAVIFLLIPSTLKKYRVSKKTLLPTLLFFMSIASIYFFLQ